MHYEARCLAANCIKYMQMVISALGLKHKHKFILMGTTEEDIPPEPKPEDMPDVFMNIDCHITSFTPTSSLVTLRHKFVVEMAHLILVVTY